MRTFRLIEYYSMKKQFGQNFLKSSKYGFQMLEIAGAPEGSTFIEIGPGNGAITTAILEKGYKVITIEIDYDLVPGLLKQFYKEGSDSFDIINDDFLNINLTSLAKERNLTDLYFIGNLPFNAGRAIIDKLQEQCASNSGDLKIVKGVFILQEEVTKNYVAKPPKANKHSAELALWAHAKKHQSISSNNFSPRPKVDAAILEIIPKDSIPKNLSDIKRLQHFGFVTPKKTLRNNLSAGLQKEKTEIDALLAKVDIDLGVRAPALSMEQWESLASELF